MQADKTSVLQSHQCERQQGVRARQRDHTAGAGAAGDGAWGRDRWPRVGPVSRAGLLAVLEPLLASDAVLLKDDGICIPPPE